MDPSSRPPLIALTSPPPPASNAHPHPRNHPLLLILSSLTLPPSPHPNLSPLNHLELPPSSPLSIISMPSLLVTTSYVDLFIESSCTHRVNLYVILANHLTLSGTPPWTTSLEKLFILFLDFMLGLIALFFFRNSFSFYFALSQMCLVVPGLYEWT